MNQFFCINLKDRESQLLIEIFGEEAAYGLFNENKGNFLSENSDGTQNILFDEVLKATNSEIAAYVLRASQITDSEFKNSNLNTYLDSIYRRTGLKKPTNLPTVLKTKRLEILNAVNYLSAGKYENFLYTVDERETIGAYLSVRTNELFLTPDFEFYHPYELAYSERITGLLDADGLIPYDNLEEVKKLINADEELNYAFEPLADGYKILYRGSRINLKKQVTPKIYESLAVEAIGNVVSKLTKTIDPTIKIEYVTDINAAGQFDFIRNKVVLNKNKMTLETAFHEFSHPFVYALYTKNRELFDNLKDAVKEYDENVARLGGETIEEFISKNYPNLQKDSPRYWNEVITTAIGRVAEDKVDVRLGDMLLEYVRQFMEFVSNIITNGKIDITEIPANATLEQIANLLIMPDVEITGIETKKAAKKVVADRKAEETARLLNESIKNEHLFPTKEKAFEALSKIKHDKNTVKPVIYKVKGRDFFGLRFEPTFTMESVKQDITDDFIKTNLKSSSNQKTAQDWYRLKLPEYLNNDLINEQSIEYAKALLSLIETNTLTKNDNTQLSDSFSNILNKPIPYLRDIINRVISIETELIVNKELSSEGGNNESRTLEFFQNLKTQSFFKIRNIIKNYAEYVLNPEFSISKQDKEKTIALLKDFIKEFSKKADTNTNKLIYSTVSKNPFRSNLDKSDATILIGTNKEKRNFEKTTKVPFTEQQLDKITVYDLADDEHKAAVNAFFNGAEIVSNPENRWLKSLIEDLNQQYGKLNKPLVLNIDGDLFERIKSEFLNATKEKVEEFVSRLTNSILSHPNLTAKIGTLLSGVNNIVNKSTIETALNFPDITVEVSSLEKNISKFKDNTAPKFLVTKEGSKKSTIKTATGILEVTHIVKLFENLKSTVESTGREINSEFLQSLPVDSNLVRLFTLYIEKAKSENVKFGKYSTLSSEEIATQISKFLLHLNNNYPLNLNRNGEESKLFKFLVAAYKDNKNNIDPTEAAFLSIGRIYSPEFLKGTQWNKEAVNEKELIDILNIQNSNWSVVNNKYTNSNLKMSFVRATSVGKNENVSTNPNRFISINSGNIVDSISRDFFNGRLKEMSKYKIQDEETGTTGFLSETAFKNLLTKLEKIKKELKEKYGIVRFNANEYTVYNENYSPSYAGRFDLIGFTDTGDFFVIDFKTTSILNKYQSLDESIKAEVNSEHKKQLNLYRSAINNQTKAKADGLLVVGITLETSSEVGEEIDGIRTDQSSIDNVLDANIYEIEVDDTELTPVTSAEPSIIAYSMFYKPPQNVRQRKETTNKDKKTPFSIESYSEEIKLRQQDELLNISEPFYGFKSNEQKELFINYLLNRVSFKVFSEADDSAILNDNVTEFSLKTSKIKRLIIEELNSIIDKNPNSNTDIFKKMLEDVDRVTKDIMSAYGRLGIIKANTKLVENELDPDENEIVDMDISDNEDYERSTYNLQDKGGLTTNFSKQLSKKARFILYSIISSKNEKGIKNTFLVGDIAFNKAPDFHTLYDNIRQSLSDVYPNTHEIVKALFKTRETNKYLSPYIDSILSFVFGTKVTENGETFVSSYYTVDDDLKKPIIIFDDGTAELFETLMEQDRVPSYLLSANGEQFLKALGKNMISYNANAQILLRKVTGDKTESYIRPVDTQNQTQNIIESWKLDMFTKGIIRQFSKEGENDLPLTTSGANILKKLNRYFSNSITNPNDTVFIDKLRFYLYKDELQQSKAVNGVLTLEDGTVINARDLGLHSLREKLLNIKEVNGNSRLTEIFYINPVFVNEFSKNKVTDKVSKAEKDILDFLRLSKKEKLKLNSLDEIFTELDIINPVTEVDAKNRAEKKKKLDDALGFITEFTNAVGLTFTKEEVFDTLKAVAKRKFYYAKGNKQVRKPFHSAIMNIFRKYENLLKEGNPAESMYVLKYSNEVETLAKILASTKTNKSGLQFKDRNGKSVNSQLLPSHLSDSILKMQNDPNFFNTLSKIPRNSDLIYLKVLHSLLNDTARTPDIAKFVADLEGLDYEVGTELFTSTQNGFKSPLELSEQADSLNELTRVEAFLDGIKYLYKNISYRARKANYFLPTAVGRDIQHFFKGFALTFEYTDEGRLTSKSMEMIFNYLIKGEINRINQWKSMSKAQLKETSAGFRLNGGKFVAFPFLNGRKEIVKKGVISSNFKDYEKILFEVFYGDGSNVNKTIKEWEEFGIVKTDGIGMRSLNLGDNLLEKFGRIYISDGKELSGDQLINALASDYFFNTMLFNDSFMNMFAGELVHYSSAKSDRALNDPLKINLNTSVRLAGVTASGTHHITDSKEGKDEEGNPIALRNDVKIVYVSINELKSKSANYNDLLPNLADEKSYTSIATMDSMVWSTLKSKLVYSYTKGEISKRTYISILKAYNQYKKTESEEDREAFEKILSKYKSILKVEKPVIFGVNVKQVGNTFVDEPNFVKFALDTVDAYTSKNMLKDQVREKLEDLENRLSKQLKSDVVVMAVPPSAMKLNNFSENSVWEIFEIEKDENGKETGVVKIKDEVPELPEFYSLDNFQNYTAPLTSLKTQQENPIKDKEKSVTGSQPLSHMFANKLVEGNTAHNKKVKTLHSEYLGAYRNMLIIKEQILNVSLGVVDGKPNIKKLKEAIVKNAVNLGYSLESLKAFDIEYYDNNGVRDLRFVVPTFFGNKSKSIEPVLLAVIDKKLRKIEIRGHSYALVSEEGVQLKKGKTSIVDIEKASKKLISNITWIDGFDPTKKLKTNQVIIPFKFFGKKGELLNVLDFTKVIKDENGVDKRVIDTERFDTSLLEMWGYRIPNEANRGQEWIEIVGFLPHGHGNKIIASSDLIEQIGHDFDFDKFYTHILNSYLTTNREGLPKLEVLEERHLSSLKEEILNSSEDDESYDLDADETEDEIEESENLSNPETTNLALKLKLEENKLLYAIKEIMKLEGEEKLKRSPTSYESIPELFEQFGNKSDDLFYSPSYQRQIYTQSVESEALIGAFALANKFNSILQESAINLGGDSIHFGTRKNKKGFEYNVLDTLDVFKIGDNPNSRTFTGRYAYNLDGTLGKERTNYFSAFQSMATDDKKYNYLGTLNINLTTSDAVSTWLHLGYTDEQIIPIVNQPVIKEFVKRLKNKIKGIDHRSFYTEGVVYDELLKELADKLGYNEEYDETEDFVPILDRYTNEQIFDALVLYAGKDDKKNNVYELTNDNKEFLEIQYTILKKFKSATEKGIKLRGVKTKINVDSKGIGSSFSEMVNKFNFLNDLLDINSDTYAYHDFENLHRVIGQVISERDYYNLSEEKRKNYIEYSTGIYVKPQTVVGENSVRSLKKANELYSDYHFLNTDSYRELKNELIDVFKVNINKNNEFMLERHFKKMAIVEAYKLLGIAEKDISQFIEDTLYSNVVIGYSEKEITTSGRKALGLDVKMFIDKLKSQGIVNDFLESVYINLSDKPNTKNGKTAVTINNNYASERNLAHDSILNGFVELYEKVEYRPIMYKILSYAFLIGNQQSGRELLRHIPDSVLRKIDFYNNLHSVQDTLFNNSNLLKRVKLGDGLLNSTEVYAFNLSLMKNNPKFAKGINPALIKDVTINEEKIIKSSALKGEMKTKKGKYIGFTVDTTSSNFSPELKKALIYYDTTKTKDKNSEPKEEFFKVINIFGKDKTSGIHYFNGIENGKAQYIKLHTHPYPVYTYEESFERVVNTRAETPSTFIQDMDTDGLSKFLEDSFSEVDTFKGVARLFSKAVVGSGIKVESISFDVNNPNRVGSYNANTNTITLVGSKIENTTMLKRVLLHETTHGLTVRAIEELVPLILENKVEELNKYPARVVKAVTRLIDLQEKLVKNFDKRNTGKSAKEINMKFSLNNLTIFEDLYEKLKNRGDGRFEDGEIANAEAEEIFKKLKPLYYAFSKMTNDNGVRKANVTSISEMLSSLFSDVEFQRLLNEIKVDEKLNLNDTAIEESQSLLDRIFSIIKDLMQFIVSSFDINNDSALKYALHESLYLIEHKSVDKSMTNRGLYEDVKVKSTPTVSTAESGRRLNIKTTVEEMKLRVEKLYNYMNIQTDPVLKESLQVEINQLRHDIDVIESKTGTVSLLKQMAQRDLSQVENILNKEDITAFDLNLASRITMGWKEVDRHWTTLFDSKSKHIQETIRHFGEVKQRADYLKRRIDEKTYSLVATEVNRKLGTSVTAEELKTRKDINQAELMFRDIGMYGEEMSSLLDFVIKDSNNRSEQERTERFKDIDTVFDNLPAQYKNNYDFMLQENSKGIYTGNLVSAFTESFYKDKTKFWNDGLSRTANFVKFSKFIKENTHYDFTKLFELKDDEIEIEFPDGTKGIDIVKNYFLRTDKEALDYAEALKKEIGEDNYNEYLFNVERRLKKFVNDREYYKSSLDISKKRAEFENSMKIWDTQNSPFLLLEMIETEIRPSLKGKSVNFPSYQKYFYIIPKKSTSYWDSKYETIQNNPQLKAFYDYYVDALEEFKNYLPLLNKRGLPPNAIPFLAKSLKDVVLKDKNYAKIFNSGWDSILNSFTAKEESEFTTIDPLLETEIRRLPVYALNNKAVQRKLYNRIAYQKAADLGITLEEFNTLEKYSSEKALIEDELLTLMNEVRSFDLSKVLKNFAEHTITYKHQARVEDLVLLVSNAVNMSAKKLETNKGTSKSTTYTDEAKVNVETNLKKAIEYHVDTFYGKYKDTPKATGKRVYTKDEKKDVANLKSLMANLDAKYAKGDITKKKYDQQKVYYQRKIDSIGRNLSGTQTVDNLIKYRSILGIGWNVMSSVVNLGFGAVTNYVHAIGNEDFGTKALNKATAYLTNSMLKSASDIATAGTLNTKTAIKIANLMSKFGVIKELHDGDYGGKTTSERIKKYSENFMPFELQKRAEYFVQGQLLLSMLFSEKNVVKTKDGNDISLWEAFDEEGNFRTDLFDDATNTMWSGDWNNIDHNRSFVKFKFKIDRLQKQLHGNYDKNSPIFAKSKLWGRALMQFRSWMPEGIATRFQSQRYDSMLERDVKGRYQSLLNAELTTGEKAGYIDIARTLLHNMASILTLNIIKRNNNVGIMSDKELSEVDASNMRKNAAELLFFIGIKILLLTIKELDTDDEDEKARLRYLSNALNRTARDIAFYTNPSSFQDVLNRIIPLTSVLEDGIDLMEKAYIAITEGEEGDIIKYGSFRGESRVKREFIRMIPIINQLQNQVNLSKIKRDY